MPSVCSGSRQECQIGATINVIINNIAHSTCVDVTVDFRLLGFLCSVYSCGECVDVTVYFRQLSFLCFVYSQDNICRCDRRFQTVIALFVLFIHIFMQTFFLISPLPTKSKGTIGLHSVRLSVCPADQFSALFFVVLADIDLIFGIQFNHDKLQIKFEFRSGRMIFG